MTNELKIMGLNGIPLIKPGDDIPKIIFNALKSNNITLKDGDIILIAQTIISKSLGRILNLKDITPSKRANEIYQKITPKAKDFGIPIKSPELIQAILDESIDIIKSEHVLITETKQGFVCANAGIDKSNIEGETNVTLLPEDSDLEANKIRKGLRELTNKNIAVIITDSFGRPFRVGAVGVALGASGIAPIIDKRGEKDLFGYKLQSTIIGQIDNLSSAAQLVMGESDEGRPVIIIRGYVFQLSENASINLILREKSLDLFRTKNILRTRRSYKLEFAPKIVDKKIIEECIELARWAPSAHNFQQWRYIIMDKGKNREKLLNRMNKKLRDDLEKDGKSEEFIKNKINRTRENFLEAPFLILLCLDKKDIEVYSNSERTQNEYILGVQSISASATYLLLAFEMKNIAACWYCAPLFSEKIVKKVLKLPESFIPMAFFTAGYPIKSLKAPKRKDLNEIIHNL